VVARIMIPPLCSLLERRCTYTNIIQMLQINVTNLSFIKQINYLYFNVTLIFASHITLMQNISSL